MTAHASELGVRLPVLPEMSRDESPRNAGARLAPPSGSPIESARPSPWRVRPALLVAFALSLLLHLAWSLWPVEPATGPETTVLTATLEAMPAPPAPAAQPAPPPKAKPAPKARPARKARAVAPPTISAPADTTETVTTPAEPPTADAHATADASAQNEASAVTTPTATAGADALAAPAVVLPPRLDLVYKVFFGTQAFVIGDATYRFEHAGDGYRISTVGQARGLAALIVRGTGKVESRGRITPTGLKPYEFAIERGSPDKREVAFFNWDSGNVVLHDGATAQLEAPAFDPLTILWQPYFAPPSRDDQTFSLATTRKVARYTLSLQGEETIAWSRGEVLTQRWHRQSDDGKTEAWFWLAPSMHYIPVKMRITRTSRGTLEALLHSIRTDDTDGPAPDEDQPRMDETARDRPWNPMEPLPGPDAHGQ